MKTAAFLKAYAIRLEAIVRDIPDHLPPTYSEIALLDKDLMQAILQWLDGGCGERFVFSVIIARRGEGATLSIDVPANALWDTEWRKGTAPDAVHCTLIPVIRRKATTEN